MGVARRVNRHRWGWAAAAIVVALLAAGPLVVLPLAFLDSSSTSDVVRDLLPTALRRSIVLAVGVGAGTAALGTALAVLLTFYDFPLRRVLEWAVVLPLAMPAYVLTYVLLGQYDPDGPLQRGLRQLFGDDVQLPDVRNTIGAILVLTLVLYPYVYLSVRAALIGQSRSLVEAARSLGRSQGAAIRQVALPMARPAIAGGTTLAVMEALADFGTVNLLNYRALTDTIYRVWYGAFDRSAALQLGFVLLGLVMLLVLIERFTRRGNHAMPHAGRADAMPRTRLRGARAAVAVLLPTALLSLVFIGPVVQLTAWAIRALRNGTYDASLLEHARNSLLLASLSALAVVALGVVVGYAVRLRPTRLRRGALRLSAMGYAVPGSVAAAAVFLVADSAGHTVDAVLTGSVWVLIAAYVVRFTTLAVQAIEARFAAVPRSIDDAAASLGAGSRRRLMEVHLPLLRPALVTGALLVFVEVLKELPATVLLRPLGMDTLAISVWEATKESLYETAAFPALCLVLAGAVPVALLVRAADHR